MNGALGLALVASMALQLGNPAKQQDPKEYLQKNQSSYAVCMEESEAEEDQLPLFRYQREILELSDLEELFSVMWKENETEKEEPLIRQEEAGGVSYVAYSENYQYRMIPDMDADGSILALIYMLNENEDLDEDSYLVSPTQKLTEQSWQEGMELFS